MKVARDSYGEVKLIDSNAVNYTCLKYFYKQVYGFEPPSQHEVLLVGENMERRWASDDLLDGVAAKDLFDKGSENYSPSMDAYRLKHNLNSGASSPFDVWRNAKMPIEVKTRNFVDVRGYATSIDFCNTNTGFHKIETDDRHAYCSQRLWDRCHWLMGNLNDAPKSMKSGMWIVIDTQDLERSGWVRYWFICPMTLMNLWDSHRLGMNKMGQPKTSLQVKAKPFLRTMSELAQDKKLKSGVNNFPFKWAI
tara:strand:- start:105 stop:854 length:750 start_codon:yes stop_codon:yes gene_type:complete